MLRFFAFTFPFINISLSIMIHFFKVGTHTISLSDIRDINLQYDYQQNEIFVDLELNGGIQISLNLDDSLLFMNEFIQKIIEEKNL